ncbi:hypothetical protein SCFA_3610004 [anaerobic digester metagenome]|uniref:Uncharacterized protein n=1 Tax=anaerobic digester metagenome TaxID=1263854 RepID=A0A485MA60_9ZZZZ
MLELTVANGLTRLHRRARSNPGNNRLLTIGGLPFVLLMQFRAGGCKKFNVQAAVQGGKQGCNLSKG